MPYIGNALQMFTISNCGRYDLLFISCGPGTMLDTLFAYLVMF